MKIAKVSKKQQSRAFGNSLYSIQRKRMNKQKISPQNVQLGTPLYNTSWQPCVNSEIEVPPGVMPLKGTGTSGRAPWYDWLKDMGTNRNATRLHVINSNFGGLGGNYDGNIHPGSKKLNSNHLYCAENIFKDLLNNINYDNCSLIYKCNFIWYLPHSVGYIPDPFIHVEINCKDVNGIEYRLFNVGVPAGDGMKVTNKTALADNDSDSDGDD